MRKTKLRKLSNAITELEKLQKEINASARPIIPITIHDLAVFMILLDHFKKKVSVTGNRFNEKIFLNILGEDTEKRNFLFTKLKHKGLITRKKRNSRRNKDSYFHFTEKAIDVMKKIESLI